MVHSGSSQCCLYKQSCMVIFLPNIVYQSLHSSTLFLSVQFFNLFHLFFIVFLLFLSMDPSHLLISFLCHSSPVFLYHFKVSLNFILVASAYSLSNPPILTTLSSLPITSPAVFMTICCNTAQFK